MKYIVAVIIVGLFVGLIFVSGCTRIPFRERELRFQNLERPETTPTNTINTRQLLKEANEKAICDYIIKQKLNEYRADGHYCKLYDTKCICI